jgi:hypothetical protein
VYPQELTSGQVAPRISELVSGRVEILALKVARREYAKHGEVVRGSGASI